jgi:DNA end-binding protein Ku
LHSHLTLTDRGSISIGLVAIPAKLYTVVSKKSVSFNQLDSRTGSRIKMNQELQSVMPKVSRTVDIEAFVDLADIDPVFYDSAYHVAPAAGFEKPYKLLTEAMADEGKGAIARLVCQNKQYLAVIRPKTEVLHLSTMVHSDEINPASAIDEIEISEPERAMARQLIASLEADFGADSYQDTQRQQVLELLTKTAAGEEIVTEVFAAEDNKVIDLLAALEASVAAAKASRGEGGDEASAKPKKKRAAKKRVRPKRVYSMNGDEVEDEKPAAKRKSA